ncbi:hypothetical protein Glove_306g19 [Diversispora epigaea]|uniref:Uncharacterized protein n=1 Tax=Diversispora epigaea TaxID=1348612 RepID=A0A397HYG6_9GLOM|nr:hypothetical protein Glove_306g19 [Diversispora epigaea]
MTNVHTLRDINSKGYRLENTRKMKLEKAKDAYQLIDEIKRLSSELDILTSQINRSQILIAKYKAKGVTQLRKIESFQSINKLVGNKLALVQKDTLTYTLTIQEDLLKKESENLSFKFKISELENTKNELVSKVNKLECLKSEDILKPIIGGDDEKNTQNEE